MHVRAGEAGYQEHCRCDRYVNINNAWHFTTREQTVEGPFASKQAAADGLTRYVELNNNPVFSSKQQNTINRFELVH